MVDRIKHRPWRFKTDEIKQKSSKKAKKSKKVEALEEQEHASETGMTDTLWLLATCVVAVPLISKLPGGSPVLGFLLGGAGDYNQQFEQMGVSPEEVMKKIMERPDLAAKFQNPKVQQAMMDITQNPQNISKYYSDTDVMSLMTEMSQLFPDLAGGGAPPM